MAHAAKRSTAVDMTVGSITKLLISFAVPMLLGNLFQLLYNTVDVLVVGNFVGKEALAAVGSTAPVVNILVMFFNGVSVGAGVVISHYYGAHDERNVHQAIETTMAITFLLSILFTAIGVLTTPLMLRLMSTPDDVIREASTYLEIYFAGISGLLIYNMGSGILRAVGDTKRPLMFLCFSSLLNIVLDLTFVITFGLGIAGVAYATIISQFISAVMVLVLLTITRDIYRFVWRDLCFNRKIVRQIMSIGLPTGVQSTITSFSNVIVQAYVNGFGSGCMAGWSCYSKIDQFVFLPMQSMGQAATTFVSQNIGASQMERAKKGTKSALTISYIVTAVIISVLWIAAPQFIRMFTQDEDAMWYGVFFIRYCVPFLMAGPINQVVSGALRGAGDAKAPMFILLFSFVVFRQIYLFIGTKIARTVYVVGFGYPIGWIMCAILLTLYYRFSHWEEKALNSQKEE